MELLRDTGLQAIIGILGVVVTVFIYMLQKKKKRLVYTVITETPLLSVSDEIKGKIKINYESKFIQNLNLVILKIENRGNVHISSADYEKPILFSFPDSEILSAELIDFSPKSLNPVINIDSSNLVIQPLLLNKRDYITVKLVFSSYGKKVDVNARIIGLSDIERWYGESKTTSNWDLWLGIGLQIICGGLLLYIGTFIGDTWNTPNNIWFYIIAIGGVIVAFVGYVISMSMFIYPSLRDRYRSKL